VEALGKEYTMSYSDNFNKGSRREVLLALALLGGEARFNVITQLVSRKAKSTIDYNLKVLEHGGLITRSHGGLIRIRFKTPLCLLVECEEVDYAYFGLLGERNKREESETETALSLLRDTRNVSPRKIVVLTTHKAVAGWESLPNLGVEWILVSDEDISDVGRVFEKADSKARELVAEYRLIMDCTSGTKPATIAFYKLALKYYAPLVYVYEQSRKLSWIITTKNLQQQVFGDKADECMDLLGKLRRKK